MIEYKEVSHRLPQYILSFVVNVQAFKCNPSLQDALLKHVLDSEMVEPVISQLVTVLLRGCQDVNPEARLLCGECLGELGAIDPGRLDLSLADTQGTGSTFVVRHTYVM